jgi:antitoxin component YwqK of YwqJK toxin-antitoxin module
MQKWLLFFLMGTLFLSCGKRKKIVTVHPDGYYKEVYQVINDSIKDGPYLKYFENGVLADSCHFVNDTIHGLRKIFNAAGQLEIEETYDKGVFHGTYKTYYPNGQVKKVQNYVQNQIQGEVRQYYEDGTLMAIVQFVENLENGPFTEYHPNGHLHWEGYYLGGDFEQDTLKEYNFQGELVRKLYCEEGICQTVWTPEKGNIEPEKIFSDEK